MKRNNIKAVMDTNIFIADWFEESEECEKLLELVKNRKIRLLFEQDTIGELIYLVKILLGITSMMFRKEFYY